MRHLSIALAAVAMMVSAAAWARFEAEPFAANADTRAGADRALGFCRAMSSTLAAVRTHHPGLVPRVVISEGVFHQQTGDACAGVEALTQRRVAHNGDMTWAEYSALLDAALLKAQGEGIKSVRSRDIALAFLDDVDRRANGEIMPQIAQPLIAASTVYWQTPVLQWPRWTRVWSSQGHPKADGFTFTVRVPIAFSEQTPTASHMLRKWVFELGIRGEHVMLTVSLFPTSDQGVNEIVSAISSADPREFATAQHEGMGAEIIEASRGGLLHRSAIFALAKAQTIHLNQEVNSRFYSATVSTRAGVIVAACNISAPKASAGIDAAMTRYRPMCDLFFGSLSEAATLAKPK